MKKSLLLCLLLLPLTLRAGGGIVDIVPIGPFGGDVRRLAVDPREPDRVLLGTADGQLFSSPDFGRTWKKLRPGLGRRQLVLDSLVFDPTEAQTIYAGGWELKNSSGALFRSVDGGGRWEELPLGPFGGTLRAVAISPHDNRVLAVGVTQGVLLSRDRGRTWDRITRGYRSLYNVHSLAFDPVDPETLYVGTWQLAWKTKDLGRSWVPIHEGMFWDSDLFDLKIDPRDPSVVFAAACSGIYKSISGGSRWQKLRNGLPETAKRTQALAFDPADPERVYAGTTAGLYFSADSGDSWKRLLADVTVNTLVVHPRDSRQILVGTDDAGLFLSQDAGATFADSNRGFHQRQATALVQGRRGELFANIMGDGSHGGFIISNDGGQSWQVFNDGRPDINSTVVKILPGRANDTVYLATSRGLLIGRPPETPWRVAASTGGLEIHDVAFADAAESRLLLSCAQGLFRFETATGHLARLKIPVYEREFFAAVRDPTDGALFVGTEMGVFRSEDGGDTWQIRVEGLPYLPVYRLFAVAGRLFAGSRSVLYTSSDRGRSWRQTTGIFPVDIVSMAGDAAGERIYASDSAVGYLFISADGGDTWTGSDISLEASRILSLLETSRGEMLAATLSEGIVRLADRQAGVADGGRQ